MENAAKSLCQDIYDSDMTTSICKDLVAQVGIYYVSCLFDVAATNDITTAERSIAALAVACASNSTQQQRNSLTSIAPILASYSKAFGPGVTTVIANMPATFTIQTNNALNNQSYDSSLQFSIQIDVPNTVGVQAFVDNADGTYVQQYFPTTKGHYLVHVSINIGGYQLPIHGSPFTVNVLGNSPRYL
jgi:hypothetical protein